MKDIIYYLGWTLQLPLYLGIVTFTMLIIQTITARKRKFKIHKKLGYIILTFVVLHMIVAISKAFYSNL